MSDVVHTNETQIPNAVQSSDPICEKPSEACEKLDSSALVEQQNIPGNN